MKSSLLRLLLVPVFFLSFVATCCGPTTEPNPPAPPVPAPDGGPFRQDCLDACEHVKPLACAWMTTPNGRGCNEWCTFYADRKKIDPVCLQRSASCDEADRC